MRRRALTAAAGTFSAALILGDTKVRFGTENIGNSAKVATALRATWINLTCGTIPNTSTPSTELLRKLESLEGISDRWLDRLSYGPHGLWPDLALGDDPSNLTSSAERLETIARAWSTKGLRIYRDEKVASRVEFGLRYLLKTAYGDRQSYGNWWEWKIGTPKKLLSSALLLKDALPQELLTDLRSAVDSYVTESVRDTYTGANLVDLCIVLALRSALIEDIDGIYRQAEKSLDALAVVNMGDGFYADGSFIQHGSVPYTNSYGAVLLSGIMQLTTLSGSLDSILKGATGKSWQHFEAEIKRIIKDSFLPVLHDGLAMDGMAGRAQARGRLSNGIVHSDHSRGQEILSTIAFLSDSFGERARQEIRSVIRGHLERDGTLSIEKNESLSIPAYLKLSAVLDDAGLTGTPELAGTKIFARMDRVVCRARRWTASISMNSRRTSYYETGNLENPSGWHSSSGMVCWWGNEGEHGDQYSLDVWPTIDPYALPGTTVSLRRLQDGAGGKWGKAKARHSWAGGASFENYFSAGMTLSGLDSTLTGRKSWFSDGSMLVCLGAAISCRDDEPVVTNLDNRMVPATAKISLGTEDDAIELGLGEKVERRSASWAHIEGHAGYIIWESDSVHAEIETRVGSWVGINAGGGSAEEVSASYATLRLNSGPQPRGSKYAYAIIPGASLAETRERDPGDDPVILENSSKLQMLQFGNTILANFFEPSAGDQNGLAVSSRCAIVDARRDAFRMISVSDPTQLSDSVEVVLFGRYELLEGSSRFTLIRRGASTVLTVDLTGLEGVTCSVRLRPI